MENTRIAIYIRLSMADEETGKVKSESNSVVNQRGLIHRFLDGHKELAAFPRTEFVDDGFSGTNGRDGFRSALQKISPGFREIILKWGITWNVCSRFLE